MKRIRVSRNRPISIGFVIFFLWWSIAIYAQFAGGSGTAGDPWLVSNAEQLDNVRNYLGNIHSNKHFLQIADIDLDTPPWNLGDGWNPIGFSAAQSFTGYYDGNYHSVIALNIDRNEANNIGLFGYINGGTISNLRLKSISVTGQNFVGGLIGYSLNGSISNCSVSGVINGNDSIGGLAGILSNNSVLNACFNTANINGRLRVAGITGSHFVNSTINNCYSTGEIRGESGSIGGLIGRAQNSLTTNSYSTGRVTTPSQYLGGLVGSQQEATTRNSFWDTETSGLNSSMGGEGRTTAQMTYPYAGNTYTGWNFNDIWKNNEDHQFNQGYPCHKWSFAALPSNLSAMVEDGVITLNWRAPSINIPNEYNIYRDSELIASVNNTTFSDRTVTNYYTHTYYVTANYDNWESEPTNVIRATAHPTPPFIGSGTEENPFVVESIGQLSFIRNFNDCCFVQAEDIDASIHPWNIREGWEPIGYYIDFEHPENNIFSGTYDGNGYTIDNLTINNKNESYQGLFGYTQEALIKNVKLNNANIVGDQYVGGIVGFARDTIIEKCCVSGTVKGEGDYSGGLVGYSIGIGNYITNSYANAKVFGSAYVGGLVGYSTTTTYSIANCYATGASIGISNCVGGLIGYSWGDILNSFSTSYVATTDTIHIGGLIGRSDFGRANNCYWDTDSSGQLTSAGGTPKNTRDLLIQTTFETWDFDTIWCLDEKVTYPWFAWQESCCSHNIPGPYRLQAIPGSGVVRLNWNEPVVGEVEFYDIVRNEELITTVSFDITHYIDTDVTNYLHYTYSIIAHLNDTQTTCPSNPVTVIPFTFIAGNGTINNPYLINTADQLHAVKSQLSNHFRQIADIDLGDETWTTGLGWEPIGSSSVNCFTGSYDGGGHRIINMTINNPHNDYQGLFGYVKGGRIQNIGVIDYQIKGRNDVGGLAGRISNGVIIDNCYAYGNVAATGVNAGGLIGSNRFSRITNSFSYGQINANTHNVGGLVGWNESSTIENCYSMVNIEITPLTDFLAYDIGGLVGFNINNSRIYNCRAGGNIKATLARRVGGLAGDNSLTDGEIGSTIADCYATGNIIADSWAGGLVGRNYSTPAATQMSEIRNSYSTGNVFASSHNAGGLVGRNDNAVINTSYSTSFVSVQSSNAPYNQGGLVGRNTIGGIINNCYATGSVDGHARVGGLVGDNFRDTGDIVQVTNSYSTGKLKRTGSLPIGGLIARNEGGEVTFSFWDKTSSGINDSAAGLGATTNELTYPYAPNPFWEWDFERIWTDDVDSDRNNGYPFFQWQRFVTTLSIRGNEEVLIPIIGTNRYQYEARIYDQNDASMPGSVIIWSLEDTDEYENVKNKYVTIDILGNLTISKDASEGVFVLYARSEAEPTLINSLRITLIQSEINLNPMPAINPHPQHRAEYVDYFLDKLHWEYVESIAYKDPTEFKVYLNTTDNFGENYRSVPFVKGQNKYCLELDEQLIPQTTYFWKVIPTNDVTTRSINQKNKKISRRTNDLIYCQKEETSERGDAQNCPVWSFTTTIDTYVDDTVIDIATCLKNNYPNPFNPETTISFSIAEPTQVIIEIFNCRGQKTLTLFDGFANRGHYKVTWNGKDYKGHNAPTGVYFYKMKAGDYAKYNKMLLLK